MNVSRVNVVVLVKCNSMLGVLNTPWSHSDIVLRCLMRSHLQHTVVWRDDLFVPWCILRDIIPWGRFQYLSLIQNRFLIKIITGKLFLFIASVFAVAPCTLVCCNRMHTSDQISAGLEGKWRRLQKLIEDDKSSVLCLFHATARQLMKINTGCRTCLNT